MSCVRALPGLPVANVWYKKILNVKNINEINIILFYILFRVSTSRTEIEIRIDVGIGNHDWKEPSPLKTQRSERQRKNNSVVVEQFFSLSLITK